MFVELDNNDVVNTDRIIVMSSQKPIEGYTLLFGRWIGNCYQ